MYEEIGINIKLENIIFPNTVLEPVLVGVIILY